MTETPTYDCLIAGAGPIGLTMANALSRRGVSYCLCGSLPHEGRNSPDLRTAALFSGSIRLLERLGVWQALSETAAPLSGIRIVDDTERLLRAPEQLFAAADLGQQRLGYNIANPALVRALVHTLDVPGTSSARHDIGATITDYRAAPDCITATLADGTERRARLVIAADGRNSPARTAAGIPVQTWSYDQTAITAHLTHSLPHHDISTEIHTPEGPCTVVPFGDHRSSLVWMMKPETANRLTAGNETDFTAALENQLHGVIGTVTTLTPRRTFPLSSLIANRFGANRTALIGEAGHAFPPIGAQGLNLGLRDVATLLDHICAALDQGNDPGSDAVLNAYSAARQADVTARTYGVDAMNASLSGRLTGLFRGALLHATTLSPAVRRSVLSRGMAPLGEWPSLMRTDA